MHASRRALSARAVRLDGRPYAVTIALPPGYRAKTCRSARACVLEPAVNSVRLVFSDAGREELRWEVEF